ncbi:hypothetical protein [Jatrophihabitans sp.]|uniref:hypothetical protein n=1 Tax=Jatrophihabitans sp. TaxID=1932789 RepID=UPI0030C6B4B9|nr:hypothetical protein [Jatrophihabitans sp.]
MAQLEEIGERDGWRCWLCDEPVDPQMSVNDARGPSIDGRSQKVKGLERLAHRGCNTKKGAIAAVVPWPERLFVSDPAPLIGVAERLARKGGREVVARCPTQSDADETASWLIDRLSRLAPDLAATAEIQSGGGQYLVAVRR